MVGGSVKRVLPIWKSLWNPWGWAGDLLVDWSVDDLAAVMDQLVLGLQKCQRPWLWFDAIPTAQPAWQQLIAALARRQLQIWQRPLFDIGYIDIHGAQAPADFATYQANWSGNFRRQMRKMVRRAEEVGGVQLEVQRPTNSAELQQLLQRGFAVEDRSWKGTAGSSILKQPQVFQFYIDQATLLMQTGQLELAYLTHQGTDIAFEYGWFSKGVYFTPKVGMDDNFRHLSPGQLIRYLLLEQFFNDPTRQVFDFMGPLAEATSKWITGQYPVTQLIISTGNWGGNSLLKIARDYGPTAKELLSKCKRIFRKTPNAETAPASDDAPTVASTAE